MLRESIPPLIVALAALVTTAASEAAGQIPPTTAWPPPPTTRPPPSPEERPPWTFDLSGYTIDPPEDGSYAATVFRADCEELHLEARWNYEDRHTGSMWGGWNFSWESEEEGGPALGVTPMIGFVAGETDGVAPGLLVDASWGWFELWNESEYLFDADDPDDDFLYTWTELTMSPVEWLRFGVVGQRTQVFDTELLLDRGLLLGLQWRSVSGTVYWFNPDKDDAYFTFALGFSF